MKILLVLIFIFGITFVAYAQTEEFHRLDDKIGTLDGRVDNHLEAASELLAEIKTKLNWSIIIGATLITGLLIPWVRKKIGIGMLVLAVAGITGCAEPEPLEVCFFDRCGDRCFTDKECGGTCYCNYYGQCEEKEIE